MAEPGLLAHGEGPATLATAPLRAAPLRYSAPSTARYAILILALLCSGLFAGTAVHNFVRGDTWTQAVAQCDAENANVVDPLDQQARFEECSTSVERQRALYATGGLVAAAGLGVLVLIVAPHLISRRRGLRPLPLPLADARRRVSELAAGAGIRQPPVVKMGRGSQRDAFSYGIPGRYRIALPPKLALRWRDADTFDPVVLHELAHISHHDVALAWLARGAWWATVPLLVAPLMFAVGTGDFSTTLDYMWRAAVILVLAGLVAEDVLRIREHEADVAVADDPRQLPRIRALLTTMSRSESPADPATTRPGARRSLPSMRDLLAHHPSVVRRAAVVDDPTGMLQPSIVEAFTAALLTMIAQPLLQSLFTTALTGTGAVHLSAPLAAGASALLLSASIGVGLWRALVYSRVSGRQVRIRGAAVAVGLGMATGHVLSFAQVGLESPNSWTDVGIVLLWVLAGAGATEVVAGLGMVWSDFSPRVRSPRTHRSVALLCGTAIFALAVWAAATITTIVSTLGWVLPLDLLLGVQPAVVVVVLLLGLVISVAVPLTLQRASETTPPWATADGSVTALRTATPSSLGLAAAVGLACGLGGCLVLLIFRIAAGPAPSDAANVARVFNYMLLGAAAGVVSTFTLAATRGARGAALAFVSIPIAVATTMTGFAVLNAALGGTLADDLAIIFLTQGLTASVFLSLPLAAVAMLHRESKKKALAPAPAGRHVLVVSAFAFVSAAVVASGIMIPATNAGTGTELGGGAAAGSDGPAPRSKAPKSETTVQDAMSEQLYLEAVAPLLAESFVRLDTVGQEVEAYLDRPLTLAREIRVKLIPIVESMRAVADPVVPATERLDAIHGDALDAIEGFATGYNQLADALERHDGPGTDRAVRVLQNAIADRGEWIVGVDALHLGE
jgi:Zn-dependent protease with chaperone function